MLSAKNQRGGRGTATLKVTGAIKKLKRKEEKSGKHEEKQKVTDIKETKEWGRSEKERAETEAKNKLWSQPLWESLTRRIKMWPVGATQDGSSFTTHTSSPPWTSLTPPVCFATPVLLGGSADSAQYTGHTRPDKNNWPGFYFYYQAFILQGQRDTEGDI